MSDEPLPLYLIAHKVRGEPAFDIATVEEVEGEETWIIPTSGHRAYPYWCIELATLGYVFQKDGSVPDLIQPMPSTLRDHYIASASPRPSPTAGRDILSTLGLIKPVEPIKRRI